MKSGRSVASVEEWPVGQSVEAQKRTECCQKHQLVQAWLKRRPLAGKQAQAG